MQWWLQLLVSPTRVLDFPPINRNKMKTTQGFPGGSDGKESACHVGDPGSIPELGRYPREENGYPLQYSLPREFHGQRSLSGYSSWDHKELDMTEQLSIHKGQTKLYWVSAAAGGCEKKQQVPFLLLDGGGGGAGGVSLFLIWGEGR